MLQEQQQQPLNDSSVESLIEPLELLNITPLGQSSPKSEDDEFQDWDIPVVKRQDHGSFDMLDDMANTNSDNTDGLGETSQRQHAQTSQGERTKGQELDDDWPPGREQSQVTISS